jgi:RNA polymerase sigma-70 factor, ECF subfamily
MLEGLGDAQLVQRIARRDAADAAQAAEAELCRRFAPRVRLYGLRHLRTEDRAADLVQAVLLALLEAARDGRIAEPQHVDRFVLGTCRNIASRVRDREARATPTDHADLERHAGALEPRFERIDTNALLRCLTKLDERARSVVLLSFQAERETEEIAKLFDTSSGNIRLVRHRALADLRSCLDRPGASAP